MFVFVRIKYSAGKNFFRKFGLHWTWKRQLSREDLFPPKFEFHAVEVETARTGLRGSGCNVSSPDYSSACLPACLPDHNHIVRTATGVERQRDKRRH